MINLILNYTINNDELTYKVERFVNIIEKLVKVIKSHKYAYNLINAGGLQVPNLAKTIINNHG